MMDTLQKVGDAIIKDAEGTENQQIEHLTKEIKEMKEIAKEVKEMKEMANEVKEMKENLNKTQDQLALILSLLQKKKEE